jgi:hypothetical protein
MAKKEYIFVGVWKDSKQEKMQMFIRHLNHSNFTKPDKLDQKTKILSKIVSFYKVDEITNTEFPSAML